MELRTQKIDIFPYNETGDLKAHIFDHNLCRRLNKLLKQYDNGDYVFHKGDEAIFKFKVSQVPAVKQALGIKG